MEEYVQFKKLNKVLTLMCCIIGVLFVCHLEAQAETLQYPQQQTDIVWNMLSKTAGGGSTIGTSGKTTYYYVESNTSYDASTKAAGTSGLIVNGTVYLYIPSGVTLTCVGAAGNGTTPGGAGIEVNEGNSLYILGAGTLSATGGKAGNGGNGVAGGSASASSLKTGEGGYGTLNSGYGGAGGNGGGGAGAGIGTKGAAGVSGGSKLSGLSKSFTDKNNVDVKPSKPNNGANAKLSSASGRIYKSATVTIKAVGGAKGSGGSAGGAGKAWFDCGTSWKYYYSVGAGGGGGGGGGGYAAAAIGKGGDSGAGGGSGVNGGIYGTSSAVYYARSGKGGTGGYGGTAGSTAGYQSSKVLGTGFASYSGSTNGAAKSPYMQCWGLDSSGNIVNSTSASGGRSGTAGADGTSEEPTTTSFGYSVKFLNTEGAIVDQIDYLFTSKKITAPLRSSADDAISLIGWQLVDYGNTLSDGSDALTKAESELYSAGEKIQLSQLTYGNITLKAVTEVDYSVAFNHLSDSGFSTDSLNNMLVNTTGGGLANKISDTAPTSTLKVILLNESDSVDLYKLADCSWDYANKAYARANWVESVSLWFSNSDYKSSEIRTNPLLISEMTASLKSAFFNSLILDDGNVISGSTPAFTNDQASVKGALDSDGAIYSRFENVPAGIYAVISEDSYLPVVISIFPYQNGPAEAWYLDSEYIAKLKHSDIAVNKWINENDIADTIAYKDTVSFDIDFTFASLSTNYSDRVTLTGDGTDTSLDYRLYAIDTMSQAFSIINSEDNKPTVTYSINDGEAVEFPDMIDYFAFADESYTGDGTKVEIDKDNYSNYLYNGNYLLENFEGETLYAVSKSAPVYTLGTPDIFEDGITTLSIIFNAQALKAFAKAMSINLNDFVLTLHYQATVTDKLEIGSDNNTNEITLHYEETLGKMAKKEDTVYGYSYGLQVIKIDGTRSNEEATYYLPNAKFKLYKEVEDEPENLDDVYAYEDNDIIRYFVPVTNIFTELQDNLDENGEFISTENEMGIIIKGLKEGCYILEETDAPIGYNDLAEDIYFEINKLEKDDAENNYGGKYKVFNEMELKDEELKYNATGMISLSVLNYRGFTLPSTGGAGTILFTVIGCVLMLSAIIIIVIKKHDKAEEYYM